jgi:3-oxoacyl-[acyl-carrier-protein] synthase II
MSRHRVVITGVGAVTPLGGAHDLLDRWAAGESGIRDGEGACVDFDPTDTMTPKEARRADRFTQLGLAASDQALADAGWDQGLPYDPDRIGVIIGTGIGGLATIEEQHGVLTERGAGRVSPLTVPLMMGNALAGQVSMRHGLLGETYGVVSACAAGANSIGAATRMIQYGEADAVVTGGGEAALTPLSRAAFASLDALSETGVSRPFDRRRDGFVMGEGAGVLVLEDAEQAEARGATILGEVLGYGSTADAHHLTAPEPDGRGATKAIQRALRDADLLPEDVDYVNAHGTSTPLNDRAETAALKAALGEHAANVPVSSTKSAIGHLLGAAGAVEAIATVLALRKGVAPPTLNLEEPDEGLDLDYVPGAARELRSRGTNGNAGRLVALSNAFGFGGHNAVLCLGVAEDSVFGRDQVAERPDRTGKEHR